jgi:hypothetical protein
MRDTTKLIALGRTTPAMTKAQIQIYSPAGEGLLLFSVDISPSWTRILADYVPSSGTRGR